MSYDKSYWVKVLENGHMSGGYRGATPKLYQYKGVALKDARSVTTTAHEVQIIEVSELARLREVEAMYKGLCK
jgi:hypothetical protein